MLERTLSPTPGELSELSEPKGQKRPSPNGIAESRGDFSSHIGELKGELGEPKPNSAALPASERSLVVIGIDPGTTTGFALYDVAERALTIVSSASFFDACAMLRCASDTYDVRLVVVEDSRSLPIYARNRRAKGQALAAVGRSVGVTDRDTTLWLDLCERLGLPAHAALPGKRKKWSAADLLQVTGYEGRSNAHARDAARLAYEHRHLARLRAA